MQTRHVRGDALSRFPLVTTSVTRRSARQSGMGGFSGPAPQDVSACSGARGTRRSVDDGNRFEFYQDPGFEELRDADQSAGRRGCDRATAFEVVAEAGHVGLERLR